jgi:hypothetical protein
LIVWGQDQPAEWAFVGDDLLQQVPVLHLFAWLPCFAGII